MPSFTTIALSWLTAATAVSAIPFPSLFTKRQDSSCTDVKIFLAKGWNEPYPGRQGKLAGAICYGIPSCSYEDILYTNYNGTDFCQSVSEGDKNGVAQMTAYADKCPDSTLVITGYSQGAVIVGDILGGSDGAEFSGGCTIDAMAGLDKNTSPGNKIAAALMFGDPEHTAGQWYNYLDGAEENSNDPRPADELEKLAQYTMRSYCTQSDPICAGAGPGPFEIADHLNYFDLYTDDAAGWVKYVLGY